MTSVPVCINWDVSEGKCNEVWVFLEMGHQVSIQSMSGQHSINLTYT